MKDMTAVKVKFPLEICFLSCTIWGQFKEACLSSRPPDRQVQIVRISFLYNSFRKMKMAGENKKLTIKVLSEEIVNLKQQVEELQFLKVEFSNMQDVVSKLLGKDKIDKEEHFSLVNENTAEDDEEKAIHCNLCDESFENKKSMKIHMKMNHPQEVKCDEFNVDLEIHMNLHSKPKMFKCDLCEKTFHLEWRLTKHISGHLY